MMEKLIELTNRIEDKELRKKVIDYLKNPTLSHKDFKKYPKEKIERAKTYFTVGGNTVERDVLNHTISVVETCISIADSIEKNFGTKIKKDILIAGALVHDIMKIYEWKLTKGGTEHTGIMLDHSFLGVSELYRREFPEEVIHLVASHFGEGGTTPPRTIEAFTLHNVDNMFSIIEHHINSGEGGKQVPILLLDEETLKKLGEKSEQEKPSD